MANRTTFSNLSAPPVPGGGVTGFAQQYAERIKQLFDASALPLTAIGGTANAVTATLDPVLDGSGLVDGMKFTLTFGAANTGGMTLAINGGTALAVLDASGTALISGAVSAGMRSMVEYIGGVFRILTDINASAAGGLGPYAVTLTTSQTWNRPAGYAADTLVRIQVWGGGQGGQTATPGNNGGGGGGYIERILRYAQVPTSVVATIGAGGAAGNPGVAGGNTSFGSLVTAFGGANTGGGGELEAGKSGGAEVGGGAQVTSARTIWGGGGGATLASDGGNAVFGGAGGGGRSGAGVLTNGGASLFGGDGGNGSAGTGSAGSAPGGGGGGGVTSGGAGARGEIRIQILG